jgi:excisionase family DNA binding protein
MKAISVNQFPMNQPSTEDRLDKTAGRNSVPPQTELTTQEAADLLNVSRPFVLQQIEAGALPHHQVDQQQLIHYSDLMAYKERVDRETSIAIDEMVAISEELGLYD